MVIEAGVLPECARLYVQRSLFEDDDAVMRHG